MKTKIIIFVLVISVLAYALFLIISFKTNYSQGPSAGELVSASEQKLQSQIKDLSTKISSYNNVALQLQSQIQEKGESTLSSTNQQGSSDIDNIIADQNNLMTQLDSLQKQVAELQDKADAEDAMNLTADVNSLQQKVTQLQSVLKAAETTIGITPVILNGLSIMFITNDTKIGVTGSASPNTAQFAIKIINTTKSTLNNVDVTGTITSSNKMLDTLAIGYPQLTDGVALCSYTFYISQAQVVHFEAFGNAKTGLSIPVGGSITLRPKISILAQDKSQTPDTNFQIALETITYDLSTTK